MTKRSHLRITLLAGIALGVVIILLISKAFGATESVSIDTKTKKVQNPIVNFGAGNTLNGTGATIIGFPGSAYTFAQSLLNTAGTVTLLNDSATPGNSKYYGTDSGGTRGYFNLPTSGGGTFIDLDFTGNNMTFMNGTTMWKSTGDSNDPVTHPYTATTSGIIVKDANNEEVFRIWASDPDPTDTNYNTHNLYIGSLAGENQPSDNTSAGFQNTGVGAFALQNVTTGFNNTALGHGAGVSTTSESNNISIGHGVGAQPGCNRTVIIGNGASSGNDLTNIIALGDNCDVWSSNTAVIGNSEITDVYFGGTESIGNNGGTAKIHASNLVGGFTAHFSRGGAAIQANDVTFTPWTAKNAGTISGYIISVYPSGTCTLKVWKKATGTAIPTIADVINTSGVSLSTGTHVDSATVTDFTTTAVAVGDQFMAQVTATSGTATDITFQVPITK